jgi:hypothetical protein
MDLQKGNWSPASLLRQTAGIAVAVVMVPVVILVQIPLWLLGLQHAKRTPAELSVFLRGLRDGTLTDGQWDEFECLPIKVPELEAIRKEALAVRLPLDEGGRAKIAELLLRLN